MFCCKTEKDFFAKRQKHLFSRKSFGKFLTSYLNLTLVFGILDDFFNFLVRGSHRLLLQKAAESRKEIADFCCRKLLLSECKIKTKRRVDSSLSRNRQKSRQNHIDFNCSLRKLNPLNVKSVENSLLKNI